MPRIPRIGPREDTSRRTVLIPRRRSPAAQTTTRSRSCFPESHLRPPRSPNPDPRPIKDRESLVFQTLVFSIMSRARPPAIRVLWRFALPTDRARSEGGPAGIEQRVPWLLLPKPNPHTSKLRAARSRTLLSRTSPRHSSSSTGARSATGNSPRPLELGPWERSSWRDTESPMSCVP